MARKAYHHQGDNRIKFQEFLLDHDEVYRLNYRQMIRNKFQPELRQQFATWLFRSSVARMKRAGVLDHTGKPALNSMGQAIGQIRRAA